MPKRALITEMKRRYWATVMGILAVTILASLFVIRNVTVRYAGVQPAASSPIWRQEGYRPVKPDRQISRMVTRATFDHMFAPIKGLRGKIIFEEARGKGDELYLFFRPANVSDSLIVYCGSRHDGKLLWKMLLGFDA